MAARERSPGNDAEQEEREHEAERVGVRAQRHRQQARPDDLVPERCDPAGRGAREGNAGSRHVPGPGRGARSRARRVGGGQAAAGGNRRAGGRKGERRAEVPRLRDSEGLEQHESRHRGAHRSSQRIDRVQPGHRRHDPRCLVDGVSRDRRKRSPHQRRRRKHDRRDDPRGHEISERPRSAGAHGGEEDVASVGEEGDRGGAREAGAGFQERVQPERAAGPVGPGPRGRGPGGEASEEERQRQGGRGRLGARVEPDQASDHRLEDQAGGTRDEEQREYERHAEF